MGPASRGPRGSRVPNEVLEVGPDPFRFAVAEDYVLGPGKGLSPETTSDPERTSGMFGCRDIPLLRSRWQLELEHHSSSDGRADHLRFEYPFFSPATPKAGGVRWSRDDSREYHWSEGERRVAGESRVLTWEVWGGVRVRGGGLRTDRSVVGRSASAPASGTG